MKTKTRMMLKHPFFHRNVKVVMVPFIIVTSKKEVLFNPETLYLLFVPANISRNPVAMVTCEWRFF